MFSFDTLDYTKRAELAGTPRTQAEFQAHELLNVTKMIGDSVATKADIQLLQSDIKLVRVEITTLKNDLIVKLGAIMVTCSTFVICLVTYLK